MARIENRQKARAAFSAKEMLEEYFFAQRAYAPAAVMLDLTHWNQFEKIDSILVAMEEQCGPADFDDYPDPFNDFDYPDYFDEIDYYPSTYAEELYLETSY